MKVNLNGNIIDVPEKTTIEQLLQNQQISPSGIAVAINNNIIPKNNWKNTQINNNDKIIIITATQGG